MHHFPASKGDSLCPLGFHPQVRWPTRCKRCFRDYKEHYHKKKEEEKTLKKNYIASSNPSISNNSKTDYPRSWTSSDNLYEGKLENELTGYQSTLDLVNLDDSSSAVPTFNLRLPRRRNSNENQTGKSPFDTGNDKDKNSTFQKSLSIGDDDKDQRRIQIKEVKSISNGPTNNDVQFVIQVKKKTEDVPRGEILENDVNNDENNHFKDHDASVKYLKKKLKETQEALEEARQKCDRLGKEKRDVMLRRLPPMDNTNKSNLEFNKLQQKYNELQKLLNNQKEENSNFQLKIKILEDELSRYPKERASSSVEELRSKLKSAETLCEELMDENESLKKEVRDMEEQIDEIQDNFREDQVAEYTSLKAELEQATKNCRILSFKLRKAEKRNEQADLDKRELEKQLKQLSENQISEDRLKKIKKLEQDLADSTSTSTKLQIEVGLLNRKLFELESARGDVKGAKTELKKISRQSLIRSGSQEEPIVQVHVPDTSEIERDLREQLKFSEEEAANLRQTITRVESDNEVLLLQLKKVTERIRNKSGNVKDKIDEEDLRMQLELNDQEISSKGVQNNLGKPLEKTQTPKKVSEKTNKKLREYEQQIKELKENIDSEKQKNNELLEEANNSVKKWEDKTNKLKEQTEKLKEKNEKLSETLKKNDSTIATLEKKIENETIAKKTAQKAELDKLKTELETKNSEITTMKNHLNSILEQNDELSKKLKISQLEKKTSDEKYGDQLKQLEVTLEGEKKRYSVLEKSLEARNSELQTLKQRLTKKDPEVDNKLQAKVDELTKLNKKIRGEFEEASKKLLVLAAENEKLQNDFSSTEARMEIEKEALNSELQTMKQRLNNMISEKREMSEEFEKERNNWFVEKSKIREASKNAYSNSTDNNGLDKMRFESLIAEKQSEVDKYKKENESLSYQIEYMKREGDEMKSKLDDYEKVNKVQRNISADTTAMDREVKDLKRKLEMAEKGRKADILKCKMSYEQQMVTVNNELKLLQSQIIRFKKEKDTYKNMLQSVQKSMGDLKYQREVATKVGSNGTKTDSLELQISKLEDELSETNLEYSKLKTQLVSDKSTYEVKILEMQTKINELEEEKILNSGRTKIAGRKTCMELSWQKEREEQQRLIQETTTLARDLRQTLFEVEKERDKERLEAKRKIEQLRNAVEEEQVEAKKKIKDLQCDLLELRDAHAKLRTTNERLKRDREKLKREESMRSKSLSRTNINDSNGASDILLHIDTLKCLASEVELLDDKQKGKVTDDKRDKLNNIVSSLLNISQNLFSQTREIEREKLMIPPRRMRPEVNGESTTKLTRQGSLNRRSLSLEQTSSFAKEQNFWQTDQGSMSSLRSADSDSNMHDMSDASISSDFPEQRKKKKGIFGKLRKMTKSKSVDEGDSGILSNLLMGKKPSSLENLNNTITGIFRRGGSSSRSNSMERTKPVENKYDSSSRQRPLMKMKSESPAR